MLIPQSCSFDINDTQFEQACDTLHVDLFNSICQKSNKDKTKSTQIDNKWMIPSFLIIYKYSRLVEFIRFY